MPKPAEPSGAIRIDRDQLARLKATKMSGIKRCAPFNTPEADAVLSALEVFSPDNPSNTPLDHWPGAANSKVMIAPIGPDKPLRYNPDMSFVLVPPDQKKVDGKLTVYSGKSDPGSDPEPKSAVIESRAAHFKRGDGALRGLTLEDVQRGKPSLDADRHGMVVDL